MKAQLPRYQRLTPRPGQAHAAAPPVAAVGSIMPPQQGMPPQQPGMRHPMHGRKMLVQKSVGVKYPSDLFTFQTLSLQHFLSLTIMFSHFIITVCVSLQLLLHIQHFYSNFSSRSLVPRHF